MNTLYKSLDIKKQSFYQWKQRQELNSENWSLVFNIVQQVRNDHPGMGLRSIWEHVSPMGLGRDEFERLAKQCGLKMHQKKNYKRTTNSLGVTRFPNLIKDLRVTDVNQVWVSDITYYRLLEKFYYLTFIMDLFSRKLIGYSVSKNLMSENTTIAAMKYALNCRELNSSKKGLIFHSDGGGQYYCKAFKSLTKIYGIQNSMCESVYENPHAERLNRTLKNQYIYRYEPKTFKQLIAATAKACLMYNQKGHKALNKMSPNEFEQQLKVDSNFKLSTFSTKLNINNNYNILNL